MTRLVTTARIEREIEKILTVFIIIGKFLGGVANVICDGNWRKRQRGAHYEAVGFDATRSIWMQCYGLFSQCMLCALQLFLHRHCLWPMADAMVFCEGNIFRPFKPERRLDTV